VEVRRLRSWFTRKSLRISRSAPSEYHLNLKVHPLRFN
jgi:hypothetical protein